MSAQPLTLSPPPGPAANPTAPRRDPSPLRDPAPAGARLDTPLIFVEARQGYALYWCPELAAPVLQLTALFGTPSPLARALRATQSLCRHAECRALILDARALEVAPGFIEAALTRAGVEGLVLLISARHEQAPARIRPDLWRFRSFGQASDWLRYRDRFAPASPVPSDHARILAAGGSLLLGSYSEVTYWLADSPTLVCLPSGDDRPEGDYADHVRELDRRLAVREPTVRNALIDLRYRGTLSPADQAGVRRRLQGLRARGLRHLVLVGELPLQSTADHPVALTRAAAGRLPVAVTADFETGLEIARAAGLVHGPARPARGTVDFALD